MNSQLEVETADGLASAEQPFQLDLALVETVEKFQVIRRSFLCSDRVKAGIAEIALGILLYATLIVLCGSH